MEKNIESGINSQEKDSNLLSPESLKDHDRTVTTKEELDSLVNEYRDKGWETEEQNDQRVKLKKDIETVSSPTPRMPSATLTLYVNITLEDK